jgi:hypothetical protein
MCGRGARGGATGAAPRVGVVVRPSLGTRAGPSESVATIRAVALPEDVNLAWSDAQLQRGSMRWHYMAIRCPRTNSCGRVQASMTGAGQRVQGARLGGAPRHLHVGRYPGW